MECIAHRPLAMPSILLRHHTHSEGLWVINSIDSYVLKCRSNYMMFRAITSTVKIIQMILKVGIGLLQSFPD